MGGSRIDYSHAGKHLHTVETFLKPIELFVKYCGMQYLQPFYSYEMAGGTDPEKLRVQERALKQSASLIKTIQHMISEQETLITI